MAWMAILVCLWVPLAAQMDHRLVTDLFPDFSADTYTQLHREGKQSTATHDAPILAVGIASIPSHRAHRDAVRAWSSSYGDEVLFRFFVGIGPDGVVEADVITESSKHRDIIIINSEESYKRLVLKVFAIFDWGAKTGAKFVAKMDDGQLVSLIALEYQYLKSFVRQIPLHISMRCCLSWPNGRRTLSPGI
jgi:hypothetical protein